MARSKQAPVGTALNQRFHALSAAMNELAFRPPVAHVYNPLDYARAPHEEYVLTYARRGVPALLVGMNPGPWGMVQTGIPFGDVSIVRDWLSLKARARPPAQQHEKRPVLGLECTRSEVSGQRLWGWARDRFLTPEKFFAQFFVVNFCPLAFLEASGKNLTPDKLPQRERDRVTELCDANLRDVVKGLEPKAVIGVGSFARKRIAAALPDFPGTVGEILHPSPASPVANRGWAERAEQQLTALGLL